MLIKGAYPLKSAKLGTKKSGINMKKESLVVCIILNWNGIAITCNGKPILETCLKSLMKTKYSNMKVVVVDAESQDGSADYVRRNFKDVDLIKAENKGWVYGNNIGMQYAYSKYPGLEYIALLNDDLDFNSPDWLQKLVLAAEGDKHVGTVNCKILKPGGGIDYCGAHLSVFGTLSLDKDEETSRAVEIVGGPAMLVRRKMLDRIGLLDEIYLPFYGGDDADLSERVIRAGYTNYYIPTTTITHVGEISTYGKQKIKRAFSRREMAYSAVRGVYILLLRYYPYRVFNHMLFCLGRSFVTTRPSLRIRPIGDIAMMLPMSFTGFIEALSLYKVRKIPFPK